MISVREGVSGVRPAAPDRSRRLPIKLSPNLILLKHPILISSTSPFWVCTRFFASQRRSFRHFRRAILNPVWAEDSIRTLCSGWNLLPQNELVSPPLSTCLPRTPGPPGGRCGALAAESGPTSFLPCPRRRQAPLPE